MKTITENRDKIKVMQNSNAIIERGNLFNSIEVIANDMLGSVYYTPTKAGMQSVLFNWKETDPKDDTHQDYYRKVITEVLGYVKKAQENSVYNI